MLDCELPDLSCLIGSLLQDVLTWSALNSWSCLQVHHGNAVLTEELEDALRIREIRFPVTAKVMVGTGELDAIRCHQCVELIGALLVEEHNGAQRFYCLIADVARLFDPLLEWLPALYSPRPDIDSCFHSFASLAMITYLVLFESFA